VSRKLDPSQDHVAWAELDAQSYQTIIGVPAANRRRHHRAQESPDGPGPGNCGPSVAESHAAARRREGRRHPLYRLRISVRRPAPGPSQPVPPPSRSPPAHARHRTQPSGSHPCAGHARSQSTLPPIQWRAFPAGTPRRYDEAPTRSGGRKRRPRLRRRRWPQTPHALPAASRQPAQPGL